MTKMNIPNRLTIIRILLVPVVVAVYLCMDPTLCVIDETSGLALRDVIAFVIFAVASITDFFDGMLARKNNWITSFGKFADPIADKMLVNTVLILMVYFHQANVIAVLLMIARDLIVDGLRMSAANSGEVVSAGIFGKLKTVLQMFALVFLLLKDWPFVYMGICMDQILLWAATVASLYSGWIYFNQLKKYVLEEKGCAAIFNNLCIFLECVMAEVNEIAIIDRTAIFTCITRFICDIPTKTIDSFGN